MNETNRNSADRHIDHGRTRTRRAVLTTLSSLGIGTTVFQRAVADEASKSDDALTLDQIKSSEWVAGIELTDEQRTALQSELEKVRKEGKTFRVSKWVTTLCPRFDLTRRWSIRTQRLAILRPGRG